MRHHGAVGKLDHGVNLRLALHDHVNEIEIAAEQMHGLDTFQTFVHEGGGINRDLGTHSPRRMRQGIGARHAIEMRAPVAARSWLETVGDIDVSLPGHLLAELSVTRRSESAGMLHVRIEALTVVGA